MSSKKVAGAIIALIMAVAGGGFALSLDFSTTTQDDHSVTDSSTTVINEGDTIINEAVQDFTDDIFDDLIDRSYDYFCEEVEPDSPECDEYWED
jgi:hypothetical protein